MKIQIIKKLKILGIILILTFLISIPYLNFRDIFTHDISYHTNRIIAIGEELKLGQFPVLIHSELLDGFGYANSLFYPELFLYIPAILTAYGINFLTSYKFLIILTTFFTFLFTYFSANRIFKNKNITWMITLLYGSAFYRLTDIYERGAIGEVLALVFLPLIISGLYEIIFGENQKWWIICFGIFGIMNSHVLSLAMIVIFILIICLINIKTIIKDKKRIIHLIIAGIISLLLISSFVFPYLEQTRSGKFNVDEKIYDGEFLKRYTVSLQELINNKFIYEMDFYKGIGTILLVLPMFIWKSKNKDNEIKFMKQLFCIGIFLLFMTTSLFPWEKICRKFDFITVLQFPYRLNIIITLVFSFVGGYALCGICNYKEEFINLIYVIYILFILALLSSLNINSRDFTEENIIKHAPVGNGEYKPYGLTQNDNKVHNLANEEEIKFTRSSTKLEFEYLNSEDEMKIHIPLTYYKGYVAYIEKNGEKVELDVLIDEETKNIIISNENIITGTVTIEYKMTVIQRIGYIITYLTLVLLIIYICLKKYYIKD